MHLVAGQVNRAAHVLWYKIACKRDEGRTVQPTECIAAIVTSFEKQPIALWWPVAEVIPAKPGQHGAYERETYSQAITAKDNLKGVARVECHSLWSGGVALTTHQLSPIQRC